MNVEELTIYHVKSHLQVPVSPCFAQGNEKGFRSHEKRHLAEVSTSQISGGDERRFGSHGLLSLTEIRIERGKSSSLQLILGFPERRTPSRGTKPEISIIKECYKANTDAAM